MPVEHSKKFLTFRQSYQAGPSSTFHRTSILLAVLIGIEMAVACWKLFPELVHQFFVAKTPPAQVSEQGTKIDALLKDVQLAPQLPTPLPKAIEKIAQLNKPQATPTASEYLPKIVPAENAPQPVPEDHVLKPAAVLKPGEGAVAVLPNDVGIPSSSVLGIIDCKMMEGKPTGETLRVAMKARSGAPMDIQSIKIHVYFYEKTKEGEVTLTDSPIRSEWLKPPVDWTNNNPQILDVLYSGPAPSPTPNVFYGYIVAIYYNNELQDLRSVPPQLARDFPPPLFLTPEPK